MLKIVYVLFTKYFTSFFPVPLADFRVQSKIILSGIFKKFQSGDSFCLFSFLVLFQSKTFYFVYRKIYPVEMKSLRVERKLQWCLVQKEEEIRGNKTNFKPLYLGALSPFLILCRHISSKYLCFDDTQSPQNPAVLSFDLPL